MNAASPPPLRSIRDLIRWGASWFNRVGLSFGHGTDNALDEAYHLVLWQLKLPFDLPAAYLDSAVTDDERTAIFELLRRRVETRQPAAYLTGEAWFAGLPFHIDRRALVPRSPLAEALHHRLQPPLTVVPRRILDLCSGCGCIGIAAAYAFEGAEVWLADVDPGAAELARRNVERHRLAERLQVVVGDLYAPLGRHRFDLILANPPYVPTAEWTELAPEYRHEPRLGLDGGDDGLALVARILDGAPAQLDEGGWLICEVGGSQPLFSARWPDIPVEWLSFEHGGDGVFAIERESLAAWIEAGAPLRSDLDGAMLGMSHDIVSGSPRVAARPSR
ncbi:MAG: 50S ribosomal protein L3 N(5)-glutamine methyltransferase [Gammaproteobacteria bacterium]|nr:50S ribosomal protein L3 N(5)-glutamine methyltransferase [Gammaproteobacteria bacterium]